MKESIQNKLQQSQQSFRRWKNIPFEERQKHFAKLSEILRAKKQDFGEIITQEMKKPISQSIAEIEKCASLCDYYANAENVLKPEKIHTEFQISEVHHEPLGSILGVMPWNFPFWQAIRFAVPAILAGNTVILKHASICLKSGDTLQEIFEEAGFPEGVFLHFEISHSEIEEMIANPIIKGVSLTGSEVAGRKIAEMAGKNLKKCVLELGGSDAFIVCEDANLVKAAESAALGRLQNCGQTCIASKRFIIHEKVFDSFLFLLLKNFKKYEIGDPNDTKTNFSEMAREDLANDLEKQYQTALENGAEYILPLERISKAGFKPGILKMNEENPVNDEELFGPLAMVYSGKSDEELLAIANNTLFGLGNSVWTGDKEKALFFAENLESGTVSINQITKSDVRLPFGGTKNSGYGTELSLYALHEFVSKKTIIGNL